MFFVSSCDLVNGVGLSPTQELWLQASGSAQKEWFKTKAPREWFKAGFWFLPGRDYPPFDPEQPIVLPADVQVGFVFDSKATETVRMFANGIVARPVLDEDYRLCYMPLVYTDLLLTPMDRYQPAEKEKLESGTRLLSLRSGAYRIRRTGEFVDLCVGELPNGQPAVMYRLHLALVVGRKPVVQVQPHEDFLVNGQLLLEHGEIREFGSDYTIPRGELLATVTGRCEMLKCKTDEEGKPLFEEPSRTHLQLNYHAVEHLAQLHHTVTRGRIDKLPGPSVMFAFSRAGVCKMAEHNEFNSSSKEIVDALTASLSDDGFAYRGRVIKLQPLARITGTIESIITNERWTAITYAGGAMQTVPTTAVLNVVAGDTVTCGQVLGSFGVVSNGMDWMQLMTAIGDSVNDVLTEFLLAASEASPLAPGDYLLPQEFVYGVEFLCRRNRSGNPSWFLDFTNLAEWYNNVRGHFVLPATRIGKVLSMGSAIVEPYRMLNCLRQRLGFRGNKKKTRTPLEAAG